MILQLASFMGELEASGLLAEGQDAEDGNQPRPLLPPTPVSKASSPKPADDARATEALQQVPSATESDEEAQQQQQAGSPPVAAGEAELPALNADGGDEAPAEDSTEQRVLGALEGASGWHEVS